jgi:uncharacterized membrane protein HdeD (DUF308 family)
MAYKKAKQKYHMEFPIFLAGLMALILGIFVFLSSGIDFNTVIITPTFGLVIILLGVIVFLFAFKK